MREYAAMAMRGHGKYKVNYSAESRQQTLFDAFDDRIKQIAEQCTDAQMKSLLNQTFRSLEGNDHKWDKNESQLIKNTFKSINENLVSIKKEANALKESLKNGSKDVGNLRQKFGGYPK